MFVTVTHFCHRPMGRGGSWHRCFVCKTLFPCAVARDDGTAMASTKLITFHNMLRCTSSGLPSGTWFQPGIRVFDLCKSVQFGTQD